MGVSHGIFEPRAQSAFRRMQLAGQRWYQSHVTAVIVGFPNRWVMANPMSHGLSDMLCENPI
jgi:hypothetical protein